MLGLDEVSFRYRTDQALVLDRFSACFQRGSTTAVLGESGRGKSTLLYLAGLMLTPTSGVVTLDGARVDNLPDRRRSSLRANTIGFVFQDASLDPGRSVLENILEGAVFTAVDRRSARHSALGLMEQFGITDLARARAADLSGGQAQRVGLCRALVKRPSVLLADEPSGNLDQINGELVFNALRDEAALNSCVVVIVTHDAQLGSRCDTQLSLGAASGACS